MDMGEKGKEKGAEKGWRGYGPGEMPGGWPEAEIAGVTAKGGERRLADE